MREITKETHNDVQAMIREGYQKAKKRFESEKHTTWSRPKEMKRKKSLAQMV